MEGSSRFSALQIFFMIVVAFIVGILGVYLYFDKNNVITLPGLGTIGLNSKCKHNDADLCKFLNRAIKADYFTGSFSGTSVTTDASHELKSLWKMDGKASSRMVNYEDGAETFQMITIGETTYFKDYNDNLWWKQHHTKAQATAGNQLPDAYNATDYKQSMIEAVQKETDTSTFKKIGNEPCGTLQCFKYQVVKPSVVDAIEYIYFDDKQYILRKSRSEQTNGMIVEMTYSYDKVFIKAPTQTKDAQPGQNIFQDSQKVNTTEETLDYLQQFEQELKEKDINSSKVSTPIPPSPLPTSEEVIQLP